MVCQKNWVSEVRNSWSATYVSNISSAILYHVILSTKSYSKSLKTVEAKHVHILCLSLGLCEGNAICYLSPVDFPHKEQIMRSFDVLLCVSLNKQLSCRWFKMSCDITVMDKQRVLMHGHQGWNVRHGLCHIYMIYVYIWVVYSFCLFCCLFIIVTTQFVALYKPCKPKPKFR